MGPKFSRKTHSLNGFVYHELTFDFGKNKVATRYVTDDMWRARFSDARSTWVIWNAVRDQESLKVPPLQVPLF